MLSFSALLILSEVLVPFTAHATLNDNGRLALPDGVGVGVGSSPAHRWAGIWGGLGWRPHPIPGVERWGGVWLSPLMGWTRTPSQLEMMK
jgi:hypothetical protein